METETLKDFTVKLNKKRNNCEYDYFHACVDDSKDYGYSVESVYGTFETTKQYAKMTEYK